VAGFVEHFWLAASSRPHGVPGRRFCGICRADCWIL